MNGPLRRLAPLVLAAWTGLVLFEYAASPSHAFNFRELARFVVPLHGVLSLESAARVWTRRAQDAAAWALVNAGTLGAGILAARLLGSGNSLLRAWFLGLAPMSLLGLGLGLAGLFSPPLLGAAAAALAAAAAFRRRPRLPRLPPGAPVALLPCLLALPAALAPEFAFDSVRYHLALPHLYLGAHRIFHVDRFLFSGFPSGTEMLYGFCLGTGSEGTAKLLCWQFLPMAALALYGALLPALTRLTAILLVSCFSAMPFLGSMAAFSNADLPRLAVEFAAVACLWESFGTPPRKLWLSAGWLFGTAMGMKYLGIFPFACALLAIPAAGRTAAPLLVRSLPVAFVCTAAWLAKDWLMTGNPVFPYLAGIAGSLGIEPETLERHLRYAADWRAAHPPWSAWAQAVPLALSHGTYNGLSEALSPALFIALGFIPFASLREPRERWLVALTSLLWAAWAWQGGGIFRFLAPFYPAAFLACGVLASRTPVPRRAVDLTFALSLAVQLPLVASTQYLLADPAGSLVGVETRADYLNRVLPPAGRYLPAMARACADAGGGRLLVLGDPKAYYAPCRCVTEFEFAPPLLLHLAAASPDPARMRVRLRQAGITAALYRAEAGASAARMCDCLPAEAALERYERFWAAWMEPAWTDEHVSEGSFYQCFRLRNRPGRFVPPASELWFNLPGTEHATQDIDHLVDAGKFAEARKMARELAARHPGLAVAWYRLLLASPGTADAARARAKMAELGYGALISRE